MTINKKQLEAIKILGEYQMGKGVYICYDISPLIGFEHKESGTFIQNPFIDECGFGSVNPIEYYGEEFLNSDFLKIDFTDIEKYKNTEIIVLLDGEIEFEGMSYDFLEVNEYDMEVEEMILEATKNGISNTVRFSSGNWKVYTKGEWEKREE